MNGLGIFRVLSGMVWLGLCVFLALLFCVLTISRELRAEMKYRDRYGADWRPAFEKDYGSLSKARSKAYISSVGLVGITASAWWLYRVLNPPRHRRGDSSSRKKLRPRQSPSERNARYRRNAVVGVYFGLGGVVAGVGLVLFRWKIFLDHVNEIWLGVAVFLCGYSALIAGCYWWLKAKSWNEAVVTIGLMPLAIPLIPFVRLLLLSTPLFLPVAMVMMSLILVVVVLVLPDRSR